MDEQQKEAAKKSRSGRKGALTRSINDVLGKVVEENPDELKDKLKVMKEKYDNFEESHDAYNKFLNEEEIEESDEYFMQMQQNYISAYKEAKSWLKLAESGSSGQGAASASGQKDSTNEMCSKLLTVMNLPKIELEPYDGDPLLYHNFMSLFDENVDQVTSDGNTKLARIIQYTTGDARNAVRFCSILGGEAGYRKARDILKSRFGNPFLICEKVISSLRNGKLLKGSEDLRKFADELSNCYTTLSSLRQVDEINSQSSIAEIALRLPQYLRNRWRKAATEFKETKSRYPKFEEFVEFVEKTASEATDPVYGQWGLKSRTDGKPPRNTSLSTVVQTSKSSSSVKPSGGHQRKWTCSLCNGEHRLFYCDVFKQMSPRDRLKYVQDNKICENCLLSNHVVANCRKVSVCTVPGCGQKHTKFVHVDQPSETRILANNVQVTNASVNSNVDVLVPTVPVKVNDVFCTHAVLDTASTNSFCSQRLVDSLKLKGYKITYSLDTIRSSNETVSSDIVNFKVSSPDGRDTLMFDNVYVVPDIPVKVPRVDVKGFKHLTNLPLNLDVTHVDILIGQDNSEALVPLQTVRGDKGDPFAVRSYFGWSLNGPASVGGPVSKSVISHFVSASSLDDKLNDLWKLENDGINDDIECLSHDDKKVINLWNENVESVDGHYMLPIPWKEKIVMPNNVSVARSRLFSLTSMLKKKGLYDRYDNEIQKLFVAGYAEEVPSGEVSEKTWYLPHQAVLNSKKPEKLRVVFDCASKYQNESLNDKCYKGPNLTNALLGVLLRFRQHEFACTADVESMYYQVRVPVGDRNALRFLWYGSSGHVTTYRMTSHVFGGVWCSSAATYAMRRVIEDHECDPAVANVIMNSFYVDDCLLSMEDRDIVTDCLLQVKSTLQKGGFRLTKMIGNDDSIVQRIPDEDKAAEIKGVSTFCELTKVEDWSHIPGCDNPADLVTRGISVSQLNQVKWLHGPPFLSTFMYRWPVSTECPTLSADNAEVKKGNCLPSRTFVFMNDVSPNPIDTLIQHYSSWYRLKRAVSWWVRLKNVLRNKEHSTSGPLSVAEIEGAELLLLKHVQSQVYGKEIKALASGESVSRNSHLRSLNPLLDDDGMLCVGGRFQLLSGKQAYPYLVPHTHRIAEVIVRDVHENTAHVGLEWTLGKLRTKYWVVKARPLIKRVLRLCVPCKLMFGKPQTQKMADLPPERLVPDQPPFTFVGLDCFGPFLVKYRRSEVKRYGCVYTCFTTRAVHLEKLENLDTDSFLNSFRRFCARRGKPVKVWSDRGTNFVGGYNELLKALDKSQIVSYCAKQSIDWHFNPPHSSHMGGLWERVIRTIRKVLQGVLRNTSLTDDSLLTLFCEVESIVNSRPITKISDDITDSAALTPNHLLLLREGPVPPPGVFRSDDVYRRRWKHIQFLSDQFWRKWIREYIPELQKRHKWTDVQGNIKVGDIVLIADENTPRSLWPLGLVIEAIAGRDGLVRSVKVRTRTSQFVRPITKIVFIEGGSL